jgi:hypothetical protein
MNFSSSRCTTIVLVRYVNFANSYCFFPLVFQEIRTIFICRALSTDTMMGLANQSCNPGFKGRSLDLATHGSDSRKGGGVSLKLETQKELDILPEG